MKLKPMRLTYPPMRADEVAVWQRFLKSEGLYFVSINGIFDAATAASSEKYRAKTYLRGDDIFVLSFDQSDRNYFAKKDSSVVLTDSIMRVLTKIAYGYYLLTGRELLVTDGLRTPYEQAVQMHKKARHGKSALFGLYTNTRLVEDIWKAYDEAHKAGDREQGEIEAMAAVIGDQANKGEYVSRHLTGHAFDVRTPEDRKAFRKVVEEVLGSLHGHLIEDERTGLPHFHVQLDR